MVVAAVIVIAVVFAYKRSAASVKIRRQFGPEYDRAVQEHGSERRAEAQLTDRTKRVEKLNIRDLTPIERERFTDRWNSLQLRFVDLPNGSVAEADDLLISLMGARGYPMSDFEQRSADISVDYPIVVDNYRSAHAIAVRTRKGEVSTEDLRKAMIQYRALFDEMTSVKAPTIMRRDVA